MIRVLIYISSLFICISADCQDSVAINVQALSSIKALAGNWKGTFQWIGKKSNGQMDAHYYLTGNGTAVVEDLINDGKIVMSSVYHLDGADLRATHYCAAGNQPHLKMVAMDPQQHTIRFDMTSITNMATAGAAHVHALELTIEDEDHLRILFRFMKDDSENLEDIRLVRSVK